MIRHQAIGGDPYPGLGMGLGQNLLKGDVVRRLLKQREPPDTTVEDMIRKISSCKAGAAGHTALVSIPETRVKKRLPTPFIRPPTPFLRPIPARTESRNWSISFIWSVGNRARRAGEAGLARRGASLSGLFGLSYWPKRERVCLVCLVCLVHWVG